MRKTILLMILLLLPSVLSNEVDDNRKPINISDYEDSLYIYYPFNGSGEEIINEYGKPLMNTSHATGCHFNGNGLFGDALQCYNNDDPVARNNTNGTVIDFTNNTISFWLNLTSDTFGSNGRGLYVTDTRADLSLNQEIGLKIRANGTLQQAANGAGCLCQDSRCINMSIYYNKWVHIAVALEDEGDLAHYYINGTNVYNCTLPINPLISWTYIQLGNEDATSGQTIHGIIDDFAMFNVTLNKSVIESIYSTYTTLSFDIINTTPADNTSFSIYEINFSISGNFSENTTCNLSINGVFNKTSSAIGNDTTIHYNNITFDDGTYNYYMRCNDSLGTYQTPTYIFYVDNTRPNISTDYNGVNVYYYENITFTINFTDNVNIYEINISMDNVSLDSVIGYNQKVYTYNLSVDWDNVSLGKHNFSFLVWNGATQRQSTHNITNYYFYKINMTESYIQNILYGQENTYYLNITGYDSESFDVNFEFRGTNRTINYTGQNGSLIRYFYTTNDTDVGATGVYPHIWWVWYGDDFNTSKIPIENQTISVMQVGGCNATVNATAINFYFLHENDLTYITVDGELVFEVYSQTLARINITFNFTDRTNYSVCIFPEWGNFSTDAYIKYTHNDGFTHRYYLVNATLDNGTELIDLFNFNYTSGVSQLRGVVRRQTTYGYFKDVYVKMLRYYPAENLWRVVQMDKSDDFGQVNFNIIERSQDYQYIFEYLQQVIYTTGNMKFACTDSICELTFLAEPSSSAEASGNLQYTYTFNNDTGIITLTFSDVTGITDQVRMVVTRTTPSGEIPICNTALEASSGTLTCNVSAYTGSFVIKAYSASSPETPFLLRMERILSSALSRLPTFSIQDGAIWSLGIAVTITLAGAFSPFGALVAYIVSLVVLLFLNIHPFITVPFITIAVIMALVISAKLKQQ